MNDKKENKTGKLKTEKEATDQLYEYLMGEFRARQAKQSARPGRTVGLELKFPLVKPDGTEVSRETVDRLWEFLAHNGWSPDRDPVSGKVTGARRPGAENDTVASTETGYCKTEFSLAYVYDLHSMNGQLEELVSQLRDFSGREQARFLGHGIFPATRPGKHLLSGRSRARVWDSFHPSNRHIAPEDGDDMQLLTINAASHVHVAVSEEEAIGTVNMLNGFVPAQLALNAHSSVWLGKIDRDRKSTAESFWDMWLPGSGRVGMPERPFRDMRDYLAFISGLQPVYVEREGRPVIITGYPSFLEYYRQGRAEGIDPEGRTVEIIPAVEDIENHNTVYWFCNRLSRYYTVENRLNDQQPPEDLMVIPALTLGLVSNREKAEREIASHDWDNLRAAREAACASAMNARAGNLRVADLAEKMLDLAREGLEDRRRGEEIFLEPLYRRLREGTCPADRAEEYFRSGGLPELVERRKI